MLPLVLAAVIAQSPQVPQIFIPGAGYDAVHLKGQAGRPVVAVCEEPTPPQPLRVLGARDEPVHRIGAPACESEILVSGARPVAANARTRPGDDAGSDALELTLNARTWTLHTRPFSDGGLRVVLEDPDHGNAILFEGASFTADSSLVWAGDLNDDGYLDLVLKTSEGLATFQQLFLSDEAGLPTLVSEILIRD